MSFLHPTNETETSSMTRDTYRELCFRRSSRRSCLCRCTAPSAGRRRSSRTGSGSSGHMTAADTTQPLHRSRPCNRQPRHTPSPSRYTPDRTQDTGHTPGVRQLLIDKIQLNHNININPRSNEINKYGQCSAPTLRVEFGENYDQTRPHKTITLIATLTHKD